MSGYYDVPLLKKPVWTWEVPLYFFVGGTAGAAAMIGVAADLGGAKRTLVRDARRVAAGGAVLATPLLIADLGRPERFLNMLRVFKPRSPMSVGAWTLAVFGGASTLAAAGKATRLASIVSAATGLVMATYTGVLIGATAIPVWKKHVAVLPIHFGASALASAASLLELLGHDEPALATLATAAAAFETWTGWRIEVQGGVESQPLTRGATGVTTRIGGMFSGPLPLILRAIGSRNARTAAAASALLGSLITRIAWIEAGKSSADAARP
jgi:formate-dependent nitrite reductase membrane component NrfD